ncbi:MAG TPA: hypothetical protein DDZ88_26215 [Verrucomicrobiales bacterium]|nr:hypothetical protein [Verrucomicrobiales bacterium]
MSTKKTAFKHPPLQLDAEQQLELEQMMARLAIRNPSWKLDSKDAKSIFPYFVAQKLFFLYDDEVFELLTAVDTHLTGKQEELLDHYLILDTGDEVQLKLFQFKFTQNYDKGISTKELYAFVERMNKAFLKGDLLDDDDVLAAYKEVREAFDKACKDNPKAARRIHCYYVVNGQNVSSTDSDKIEKIRNTFIGDKQAYGFTFETYGGLDLYNLAIHGRVPLQREVIEMECPGEHTFLHWAIGKNPAGMPIQVVQGFVNVNQLIRLVDRYSNNELFEKNVRLFLGVKKEVNKRIIETITGPQSNWFGFMNNGVSITADNVVVNPPPRGKKLSIMLDNMQIINGCQTVNALYHAKYDKEMKDKFQGNSNVLVRIYHIDEANHDFLEALIIATNSQNAIRAEDLVSADPPQIALEEAFREIGVWYQRKQGGHGTSKHWFELTKETAAMAFMAVYWEAFTSRLRNAASRREIFRRGEEYYRIFSWSDDQPEETLFTADSPRERAMQMLLASTLESTVRKLIADTKTDKKRRGALKKAAYFIARGIYLKESANFLAALKGVLMAASSVAKAKELEESVEAVAAKHFENVVKVFDKTMISYVKAAGGDDDAALKNTKFAKAFEDALKK